MYVWTDQHWDWNITTAKEFESSIVVFQFYLLPEHGGSKVVIFLVESEFEQVYVGFKILFPFFACMLTLASFQ